MVLHLRSCCCGCSLRTGTQIIGWLSTVSGILGLIIGVLGLTVLVLQLDSTNDTPLEPTATPSSAGDGSIFKQEHRPYYITFFAFLIILSSVQLIVSILLLRGTKNNRPELFKPWLIYIIIAFTVEIIFYSVQIIFSFIAGQILAGLLQFLIITCFSSLSIYYMLVVNSFRKELISGNLSLKT